MADHHFVIVNPRARSGATTPAGPACAIRGDAAVCTNGNTDVACTGEIYRGCQTGQTDCANTAGNPDDGCCGGWLPGGNDNIDHASCITHDAPWGGMAWCSLFDIDIQY